MKTGKLTFGIYLAQNKINKVHQIFQPRMIKTDHQAQTPVAPFHHETEMPPLSCPG